ncbi:MAG: membrane protein insertion efficiency factor YidD, partial [Ignavibacteriales bacterium]
MRLVTIIYIVILSAASLYGQQADWKKWGKTEISYTTTPPSESQPMVSNKNLGSLLLDGSRKVYSFFISDLDGDNCPFQPTCSSFFIESVRTTNIFQGMLMFADRFTRDMNFLKINHYPLTADGSHFSDPARNYTLHPDMIIYNPPT